MLHIAKAGMCVSVLELRSAKLAHKRNEFPPHRPSNNPTTASSNSDGQVLVIKRHQSQPDQWTRSSIWQDPVLFPRSSACVSESRPPAGLSSVARSHSSGH